ncbi:hypothetical protein A9Q84_06595 [Halobacteriovorax marinus]|uniref:Outer membrane protein beta-barrel domain-containing protein n=1 Tax=Halobacteriovorax marinus TaxID=97084 RepID=A0A1Y5F9P6_9BACT|nr:hypothetical protein A9Q84_06595 [Halobacteriovorax marinus]
MKTNQSHICKKLLLLISFISVFATSSFANERIGRLGLGFSNQFKSGIPALSFKIQKSKSTALGALIGFDTDTSSGGWGAGVKIFRNIFDEPQLNFYAAMLGGLINKKQGAGNAAKTGFQLDLTLGSEFSFSGLASIGFSFEFGVSFNKVDDFRIQTVGDSFIVAAAHFYL